MKFDQVRREFKRTLWGEELDNERYSIPVSPSIELDLLHHYNGKKYQCNNCSNEHEENNILITKQGTYCRACFQMLFNNDGANA